VATEGGAAATSLGRGPLLGRLGHDAAATYSKQILSAVRLSIQCHIRFLMMWKRERAMREKEVVASRNNHPMNETTTS
jgi:hypothetical protein